MSTRAAALVLVAALGGCGGRNRSDQPAFIGAAACASCHRSQFDAWRRSQHAAAMQVATPATVLGRFDGARFTNGRVTYTFARRGDTSVVRTSGGGEPDAEYVVRYTFGVSPLQQYLVELRGGHMQSLLVAWDARAAVDGGQRWFSLSPGAEAAHSDRFHWTGRQYNWNYMCADCHSTAVRKQYVPATDSFHTTFSEINVACEACHGPGSQHAGWAKYPSWVRRVVWREDPLPSRFGERRGVRWIADAGAATAHRSAPRTTEHEIETCSQCHARRSHIADGYTAGAPLLDYYIPLPIAPGLYHPDGQQRDEVYTVASFQQSRMHDAGVTCADCHDPHTQKLRRPGNQVCAQCHAPEKFDTPSHTFHKPDGAGARCVSCHLPDTTYMVIDRRHDHSIRIPRPDLSLTLGVPNACTRCHVDRDARWSADAVKRWYPKANPGYQRFAGAFAADDRGDAAAGDSLASIANDATEPWMVRASALSRLGAHPGPKALAAARAWSRDGNAVVRLYALEILESFGEAERLSVAVPLLSDARRAVRQEAAWLIAPVARALATDDQRRAFDRAAAEFVDSQRYNADRAPSRLRLATFYGQMGRLDSAATEFRAAMKLDSAAAGEFRQSLVAAAPGNPTAAAMLRAIGSTP